MHFPSQGPSRNVESKILQLRQAEATAETWCRITSNYNSANACQVPQERNRQKKFPLSLARCAWFGSDLGFRICFRCYQRAFAVASVFGLSCFFGHKTGQGFTCFDVSTQHYGRIHLADGWHHLCTEAKAVPTSFVTTDVGRVLESPELWWVSFVLIGRCWAHRRHATLKDVESIRAYRP